MALTTVAETAKDRRMKGSGIRSRLTTQMLLVGLAPLVVLGALGYLVLWRTTDAFDRNLQASAQLTLTNAAKDLVSQLDVYMEERVRDVLTGKEQLVRAKIVVNATGPWSDRTRGLGSDPIGPRLRPTKGVHIVVDQFSAPYLQGARIDYLTGLQESGFKIDNPNAQASCGCGHSFTVEEGAEAAPDAHGGGCGSGCSH